MNQYLTDVQISTQIIKVKISVLLCYLFKIVIQINLSLVLYCTFKVNQIINSVLINYLSICSKQIFRSISLQFIQHSYPNQYLTVLAICSKLSISFHQLFIQSRYFRSVFHCLSCVFKIVIQNRFSLSLAVYSKQSFKSVFHCLNYLLKQPFNHYVLILAIYSKTIHISFCY